MDQEFKKRHKIKLFFTQFLLPQPIDLLTYLFVSLLVLLIASNRVILVILADGSPVTDIPISGVFSQRLDTINQLLATPILGRIVLFLFWLAIGSVVYMIVWLFQNLAVEVYDDLAVAKLQNPNTKPTIDEDGEPAESWWGTTIAHVIFVGSSVIVLMFFALLVVNVFFPSWVLLFQLGLQTFSDANGIIKLFIAVIGTMFTVHIFVLFWKLFFRLKGYIYNAY